MRIRVVFFALFLLNAAGILSAQKGGDPTQRYFRLICLVHLTGSGKSGDPVMPEYVADGVAAAANAFTRSDIQVQSSVGDQAPPRPAAIPAFVKARPGFVAWGMQPTDDHKMAIVQVVAVDHAAFDAILADKRPEIRVFEIGKDKKEVIERELQRFKKDFSLDGFRVVAQ